MKKSIKKLLICGLVTTLSLSSSLTTLAGTWKQDNKGWWYQRDNGSYPSNGWEWIDGNNDGIAECYYFDSVGYMLANTTTPDGYQVNADGAWISGSVVQTKKAEVQANQNITTGGRQMYFNHPKWTKEEVLAIQNEDAFNKRFSLGEYMPYNVEVVSQASADKFADYLDFYYNYANYLSSAYAYGIEKDIYMRNTLPMFSYYNYPSLMKSADLYEASKEMFKWKSFDDFYIYHMMGAIQKAPFKDSYYAMNDSTWKKMLEDMIDNVARWEGQEVPDIFLMYDEGLSYDLLHAEALYRTPEELLDYYLKEGSSLSSIYYERYKIDFQRKEVEPTQFFKIRHGWVYTPDDSVLDSWLESMKPIIREKYGVELSWHPPYGRYAAYLVIELTPIK